jgi:hydrogenase/urease accessory protein HupE
LIFLHEAKLTGMSDFKLWFGTGLEHILDLDGYDHILYVVALSIIFTIRHWKELLWIVTAFTIGHSLTLALSTLDILNIPQSMVEIWIALTILISCILNLRDLKRDEIPLKGRYLTAALFGCIHGLGFSYLLKSMLGHEESILLPLLYFNLGLEAGQIVILSGVIFVNLGFQYFLPGKQKLLATTTTFVILLLSLYMIAERLDLV